MEKLLTAKQLEAMTGLKLNTIRKYVSERKIPFVKFQRAVFFRPEAIEKWIASLSVDVAADDETAVQNRSGELPLFEPERPGEGGKA